MDTAGEGGATQASPHTRSAAERLFAGPGEMRARCRALDWSPTPLGPVERWPERLRAAAQMVLAHPFPHLVLWGPELTQLYNDGCRALMGVKHPVGLGQPTRACWPEVWHINRPIYERVLAGESIALEDARYPVTRSGVLEDAWFTLSYSPLRDEAGSVAGVLVTFFETTEGRRAEAALRAGEARQAYLLRLSDALRSLADPIEIQRAAMRVVGEHLAVDRVIYAEMEADDAHFSIAASYVREGFFALTGRFPTEAFGPLTKRLRAGETVVVPDVETSEPTAEDLAAYRAGGIASVVGVPLVKGGRWLSNLSVHTGAPRAWRDDEVVLLQETAERTWAAVERARTEARLRASEERYRALVENIRDYAIFLLDRNGAITEWTTGAERVTGYTAGEVVGRHLSLFFTPEEIATGEPARELAEAAATGRAEREGWRVRRDGTRFWADEIATAVRDVGGDVVGFTKIARDLTERRVAGEVAERVRAEAERTEVRRLLTEAEESERRHLARELHDQLGQHLAALTLGLDDARRLAADDHVLRRRLTRLGELAHALTRDARHLALELRPPELDDIGLESALQTYVEQWAARYGVAAEVAITGLHDRSLPGDVSTALYRIVQEALTNVARHADATRVSVILEQPDGKVQLIIEDDGRGFDVDEAVARARAERRLGLAGMRERSALVAGTVTVESSPGGGTTLYVHIPLRPDGAPRLAAVRVGDAAP